MNLFLILQRGFQDCSELDVLVMLGVKGIYDGLVVKPIEPIPVKKPVNVIITIVDEVEDLELPKMKEDSLSQ